MAAVKRFFDKNSTWILLAPFVAGFVLFVIIPVVSATVLSFTQYNSVQAPTFIGIKNYIDILTQDDIFMQKVLPNTIFYALIVGPGGYILSFILAWLLAQLTKVPRSILAIIIYSPSMTSGVIVTTVWATVFSGDRLGFVNAFLLDAGLINQPIAFLQSEVFLMPIVIAVALWGSMGVGFLAMLSGVLNVDSEVYEAAYIDGIKNRLQEVIYVTIPSIKPQMLFGAVMGIVNTFNTAGLGTKLANTNPTPNYAAQLVYNHIEDFAFNKYELGYAAALSIILLGIIYIASKVAYALFSEKD